MRPTPNPVLNIMNLIPDAWASAATFSTRQGRRHSALRLHNGRDELDRENDPQRELSSNTVVVYPLDRRHHREFCTLPLTKKEENAAVRSGRGRNFMLP